MQVLPLAFAFLIGAALTLQAGVNAGLRERTGQPVFAALVSLTASLLRRG